MSSNGGTNPPVEKNRCSPRNGEKLNLCQKALSGELPKGKKPLRIKNSDKMEGYGARGNCR